MQVDMKDDQKCRRQLRNNIATAFNTSKLKFIYLPAVVVGAAENWRTWTLP
jgi:hypothetical protein